MQTILIHFRLTWRLLLDKRIQFWRKAIMVFLPLVYALIPFAFEIPDFIPLVGMLDDVLLLGYLATTWTLNMYFQSYSALALIKVNSGWFHVHERGVFSAIFGSVIQSGRFLVFLLLATPFVIALPWQWRFFIPAGIVAMMAFFTFLVVQDSPKEAGLGDFDPQDATSGETEKITLSYVARRVFTNPVTITIAVAEFCTGLVRQGFEQWFPRYMQEVQHLGLDSPIFQRNALVIVGAGILGAFIAGYMSDWLFGHRRPPVAFIGYGLQVASLAVVWRAPSMEAVIVAFVVNSMAISMVHSMLSGTASMDFGGKRAAATSQWAAKPRKWSWRARTSSFRRKCAGQLQGILRSPGISSFRLRGYIPGDCTGLLFRTSTSNNPAP